MTKEAPAPDLTELVGRLEADVERLLDRLAGSQIPVLAQDPVTAMGNLGTVVFLVILRIIDTVPAEQHAENWKRWERWLDKLQVLGLPNTEG